MEVKGQGKREAGWMDGTKKGADHSARLRESEANHGNGVRETQERASGEGGGRVGGPIVLHRGRCWAAWSRRGWPTCCNLQGFCKEDNSYYPRGLIMGRGIHPTSKLNETEGFSARILQFRSFAYH